MSSPSRVTAYRRIGVSFEALPEVERIFATGSQVTFNRSGQTLNDEALLKLSKGQDALIVATTDHLTAALLEELGAHLKTIGTYSVGTEHIDLGAAGQMGFRVLNTPDVLTDAVAEVAVFLILGAARRATESIELIRSGNWRGWTPTQLPGMQLTGKRLGIFGMGRIGRAVAARARGFGLSVQYRNRHCLPADLEQGAIFRESLDALLSVSDILLIASPATSETTGLIDGAALCCLPAGALVVNIARGNIVDDEALIQALESGRVRAAGLDVFAGEPDFDRRYLSLPNVFMTPHIGSSTLEAREQMARALVDGLGQLEIGEAPPNLVCGSAR